MQAFHVAIKLKAIDKPMKALCGTTLVNSEHGLPTMQRLLVQPQSCRGPNIQMSCTLVVHDSWLHQSMMPSGGSIDAGRLMCRILGVLAPAKGRQQQGDALAGAERAPAVHLGRGSSGRSALPQPACLTLRQPAAALRHNLPALAVRLPRHAQLAQAAVHAAAARLTRMAGGAHARCAGARVTRKAEAGRSRLQHGRRPA